VLTRDQDPTIDYALFWLKHGSEQILNQPWRGVHHWTHPNYSGGRTGWEEPMGKVYFEPRTLEERLLQGQVHEVMLVALEWALCHAEAKTPYDEWTAWRGMDLAEAYRIAHMVALVDPLRACALKVRLNKICGRMNKTLTGLADHNFDAFIGPSTGMQW